MPCTRRVVDVKIAAQRRQPQQDFSAYNTKEYMKEACNRRKIVIKFAGYVV